LAKSATAKKRRKQKGVEAIFSPLDESENSPRPPRKTQRKHAGTPHPVNMFLFLQAFFIVISLFWLVYVFQNQINFGNQLYETLSNYVSPIPLLSVGVTGLALSVAWAIVNHRQDHSRLDSPIRGSPEGDMTDLSETDSRSS
jgi:hypothetical protein